MTAAAARTYTKNPMAYSADPRYTMDDGYTGDPSVHRGLTLTEHSGRMWCEYGGSGCMCCQKMGRLHHEELMAKPRRPMPCVPEDASPPRRPMPCVPEDAEEPPRVTDLEARVAALERQNTRLTEAVTMLLGMKADAEHFAITRAETVISYIPSWPAGSGGHFPPPRVHFWAGPSYTPTTTATSSCLEDYTTALEELRMNATKTDSLLAALRPGGT